jgi:hypothetical protein
MSSLVFPSFPGMDIAIKRTAIFATKVQTASSGKELRASFQSAPRYRYVLPLNFLRQAVLNAATDEVATLLAIFNAAKGRWDSFLLTDAYSNTATAQNIGTGTGLAGQTTQIDDIDGFPIADFNGAPAVSVNGVLKTLTTDYTINAAGLITWVTNPGNGLAITWSGSYYRRVRFDADELDFERFLDRVWEAKAIPLLSVK